MHYLLVWISVLTSKWYANFGPITLSAIFLGEASCRSNRLIGTLVLICGHGAGERDKTSKKPKGSKLQLQFKKRYSKIWSGCQNCQYYMVENIQIIIKKTLTINQCKYQIYLDWRLIFDFAYGAVSEFWSLHRFSKSLINGSRLKIVFSEAV